MNKNQQHRINEEMKIISQNPFITFQKISDELQIPISTLADDLRKIKRRYTLKGIWHLKNEI